VILAQEIKSLIESGITVYEKSLDALRSLPQLNSRRGGNDNSKGNSWRTRPAGYGDCAILIQSRTKLKEYEAALQAENIPYRVVGGIGFYEEDEIQALMNMLFFLWNHDDKLALAAALKSPLFGLTDKDIFDLMLDERDMVESLRRHHSATSALLDNWKRYASAEPLAGLIHRIIQDTGAYVRFGRKSPQAVFNIDKLLDTAREFDRRGYTTLQDFVEWVKNIRQTEQREATADMNLPGFQGSVSIMTVHKAKGLEYPIVFLPGMNQQPRSLSSGPLAIIEDADSSVRMAVRDAASPVYDELWEREHDELLREHQRLLYVAMTRARDHLVMIGTLNGGKAPIKPNSWLSSLHETAPMPLFEKPVETGPGLTTYAYPSGVSIRAKSGILRAAQHDKQKETTAADLDTKTVIENLSPLRRSGTPEWKSATGFVHEEKEEAIEKLFLQAETRAVSPLTRGSVLHRCLEDFTTAGAYDLNRIIREYPDILALESDVHQSFISDVSTVLNAVLSTEELRWIFDRQPNAYSELPFLYTRGNSLVSGKIDRVIIKGNKGYVIDYKAIPIDNDAALASWKDHYRPQIQIYCEAVKEIFCLRSVEGSLLFLDSVRFELTTKV
jgi:ATP-dependent helicase/nuclease subunit A